MRVPYCKANKMRLEGWRAECGCANCPELVWVCEHRPDVEFDGAGIA